MSNEKTSEGEGNESQRSLKGLLHSLVIQNKNLLSLSCTLEEAVCVANNKWNKVKATKNMLQHSE